MPSLQFPRAHSLAAWSVLLALASCGGGGGGGGSGTSGPVDNSWLSFSAGASDVSSHAGESTSFRVTATSSRTLDGVVNIGIIDTRGVIEPVVTVTALGVLSYAADLRTASSLAAGDYTGNFEVRLCRDNPTVCAQPIAGSPWQLPYRIRVRPATNLTALASLPGATAWTTYQGNAAHTGFVNATVQPANFNRRWVVPAIAGSLAVEDGRVLLAPPDNRVGALVALREADGAEQWRFGGSDFFSGVGSGGGRVWFMHQAIVPTEGRMLRGLDAATGATQAVFALGQSNPDPRLAPVVADGSVFFASDTASTISRHRAADGAEQWRAMFNYPYAQPAQRWSPAVGGGRAVMFDYHRLWLADAASGSVLGSIDGPNLAQGVSGVWEVSGAPVLGAGPLAYVSAYGTGGGIASDGGRLVAFNLDTRTVAWNVGTTVRSNPVLAGNTVYASVTGGALQAHDAATGALLWRWDAPAGTVTGAPAGAPAGTVTGQQSVNQPLIVVGNHAFIGLGSATHAVDLGTRQSVWTYPAAGPMAVSANGTLFIASDDKLHAINLR